MPTKSSANRSARWCDRTVIQLPIYYCLVLTEEDYYTECESAGIAKFDQGSWQAYKNSHATTSYFEHSSNSKEMIAIVALSDWKKRSGLEIAGLLVHEAVHIFQKYCDIVGENKPSSEFQAYSIQWISQELMEQFQKQVLPN